MIFRSVFCQSENKSKKAFGGSLLIEYFCPLLRVFWQFNFKILSINKMWHGFFYIDTILMSITLYFLNKKSLVELVVFVLKPFSHENKCTHYNKET